MRALLVLGLGLLIVQTAVAPPVTKNKNASEEAAKDKEETEAADSADLEDVMEYHRYLTEVVQALESDPEFRQKLEKAKEIDIRSGKIAHELEFVNHQVRTKLDELKRQELERLRHLAIKEYQIENGLDPDHLKIAEHLDHSNPHTFEIDDLKKLIAKTSQDLAEADRKRKEEFKEYEMQKKFEQEIKMKGMDEDQRKKYEAELHSQEEKHKKHQPLHHPGSKPQLEEVWEKQDHMENQDFDPRTFFYLHDLDGNGVWDQNEVKALFLKELDKMYAEGAPEDDLRERAEEMERMREHVFNEADLNKDGLISYNEFVEQTKKPDFQQDAGWQGLDEQQIFSQQEYEEFERRRQEDIQKLIAKGILPPHPDSYPPGHPEQFPPQYGHVPVHQGGPDQGFIDPLGARVGHPNEIPQGQQFQGQHVPQQQFQGQVPQQQFHGQVPQQQFQGHQVPQQQFQGHPVPQQQFQGQQVPQQQFQGQVPQQQFQGQQIPQQQQQHVQQVQGGIQQQQQQQQQQQRQQQQQQQQQQVVQNVVPAGGNQQVHNTGNTAAGNLVNNQQQANIAQKQVNNNEAAQQPVAAILVENSQKIVPNAVNAHS
ncbi:nucleobindin-2 isoform X2 [Neodiprion virginianus]|uniref:nucleobindin-2 isoform X2 n=1 Tax=Neodiprion virginianus TaxID=2961670 RepID=UPI001EE76C8A|nr:nucleobindin-2 isoform X2 [Neodiprion virginianus]